MLLRAAILIVLILNLGVAGWWWSGAGSARAPHPTPADGPQPRLRLASEAPSPAGSPPVAAVAATSASSPAQVAGARCVRLGPFADAAARDAALARLQPLAERLLARDLPVRDGRGWRVILPPLPSREGATAMAERMREAGIGDLYVLNQGTEANAIALGRYGSEEAARRREADLRARGFAAQAEALGGGSPQAWLDARFAADVDAAALAASIGLRTVDCASVR